MAAAKEKKPTKKQISDELQTAAKEYEHLARQLLEGMLYNASRRLGVETEEIVEEFGELT